MIKSIIKIEEEYYQIISNTYTILNEEEKSNILKAINFTVKAHSNQTRKTGELFAHHPIEVAKIVAHEMGLDSISIIGALLHDVVEDTSYNLYDIENKFGNKISNIVNGLTKIKKLGNKYVVNNKCENYRKLLFTMCEDIRVVLIKIADRLHNMRTLHGLNRKKQIEISLETNLIYSPLSHRLGLYNIKSELEDLSLKYTNKKSYYSIFNSLKTIEIKSESYLQNITDNITYNINKSFKDEKINFIIKSRTKSISSIYNKINKQCIPLEEVYDLLAIRIIYHSNNDEKFIAWKIYSIICDMYQPIPERMKDWITRPKNNGYESLHTTIIGPNAKWIEIQIRSKRMDEIAERGVAAHYKYKEKYDKINIFDKWINDIRYILENHKYNYDGDFINTFKLELFSKEIYVFSPKGDIISLPMGASVIDFAYNIHTNIGDNCIGAKINGKLSPISSKLNNGDKVEILTSNQVNSKMEWLEYVVTSKAKQRIKSIINSKRKLICEQGKNILEKKLKNIAITNPLLTSLQLFFKLKNTSDIFYNIGNGIIEISDINKFLLHYNKNKNFINKKINSIYNKKIFNNDKDNVLLNHNIISFDNNTDEHNYLNFSLSYCCNPIPGDKIFGFITISKGIKIHKENCPNAINLRTKYSYRIIDTKWINYSNISYNINVELEGISRAELMNDIINVVSKKNKSHIKAISFQENMGIINGIISIYINNNIQLQKIIRNLKMIEGIKSVRRK